jgi:hypothetical protein
VPTLSRDHVCVLKLPDAVLLQMVVGVPLSSSLDFAIDVESV